ncbi:MAG: T9SS type A sorting domain-containing protein [Ignavibacteria bacterium]|nr:T9SS type A sorting domain-containing protein [Ignavibacteria bacterium]
MKLKYLLLALLLHIPSGFSQSGFLNFLSYINTIQDPVRKIAVADSFVNANRTTGIPIKEGNMAVFLYNSNANYIQLAGDFTAWSASITMNRITNTNLFYYFRSFEMNARVDYKIVVNGSTWILDPLNPKQCPGGFGPNSELAMPEYVQPWEIIRRPGLPAGELLAYSINSTNTGTSFNYYIYLPPGYDSTSTRRYPAIYVQDGTDYLSLAQAATILDNAIDSGKIEPVIGIFVRPNNRNDEYAGTLRNKYMSFFALELVPFIDANYKTIPDKNKRLVLGDSFGGNISAIISWNYPNIFANCGLHSGAFWPNDYEIYNTIISAPKKDIKYFAIWGTYESLYGNMRSFRDTLISKGYTVWTKEFPEGHSWGLWRANLMNMIHWFFPAGPVSVDDKSSVPVVFQLLQNQPNPFNPETRISFTLTTPGKTSLKVYNLNGKEVAVLIDRDLAAGFHTINFRPGDLPSGIYFARLTSGKNSGTIKLAYIK